MENKNENKSNKENKTNEKKHKNEDHDRLDSLLDAGSGASVK